MSTKPVFTLLFALLGFLLVQHERAEAQEVGIEPTFRCGEHIERSVSRGRVPADGLRPMRDKAAGSTTILLEAGPGLQAVPEALAVWEDAVDIWESKLHDPVTITISGDIQALGPSVLGAASSRQFIAPYGDIVAAIQADAAVDEGLLGSLPAAPDFSVLLPAGFTYSGGLSATKANLRAMGFDMGFDDPEPDATIVFASGFLDQFDFDASDGISPGLIDFEAVVVHELGHALGFVSRVDEVDFLRNRGEVGSISPSSLDLLRLQAGTPLADFDLAPRLLLSGDLDPVHAFLDGEGGLGFSTGVNLGDGRQASHWKADELTGLYLGVMDPTLSAGLRAEISANDLRAFGLIGWDVVAPFVASVPDPAQLRAPALTGVYPNPFNPETTISYRVGTPGPVQLTVHDLRGALVRTLVSGDRPAGEFTASWDGRDGRGRAAASGLYLVRLQTEGGVKGTKIVLSK